MARANVPLQVYMPAGLRYRLEELSGRTKRSVTAEVLHAIERHLACPPEVTAPPLPPATADAKPRRGRPPKRP